LTEAQSRKLQQVLVKMHFEKYATADVEYLKIAGQLTTTRVEPDKEMGKKLDLRSQSHILDKIQIVDASPLELTPRLPGLLDTLNFVEDPSAFLPLPAADVEIATKANIKDCLVAIGQLPKATIGQIAAGIVLRAWEAIGFAPGDRVLMGGAETFETVVRDKAWLTCKIPDGVSFAMTAAVLVQFITAWQCVHRLSWLTAGESVLILAAAGETGQAAIRVA
jgi:hypothetical protein